MGLRFRNRVGLGAGFDKDGVAIAGWAALGFGFVELGTVTPRPQAGNPRPRLFRLAEGRGAHQPHGLQQRRGRCPRWPHRRRAPEAAGGVRRRRQHRPQPRWRGRRLPGRRARGRFRRGLPGRSTSAARTRRASATSRIRSGCSSCSLSSARRLRRVPLVVKLSPDLTHNARADIIRALPGAADGVIVSNTTTVRIGQRSRLAGEEGGLSGAPLRERALAATGEARRIAGDRLAIMASGGVDSADAAAAAIAAGADLVQLWTGMVYAGPGLIGDVDQRPGQRVASHARRETPRPSWDLSLVLYRLTALRPPDRRPASTIWTRPC